jgi:site-specific recombinase XerD
MLVSLLRERKDLANGEFVVSDGTGFVSPRTFSYRFHRVLDKSGVSPINYHALRHTFATRCIELGMDVKSLSEILGHANVSITLNTYVHPSMDYKRAQMEKLSDL